MKEKEKEICKQHKTRPIVHTLIPMWIRRMGTNTNDVAGELPITFVYSETNAPKFIHQNFASELIYRAVSEFI